MGKNVVAPSFSDVHASSGSTAGDLLMKLADSPELVHDYGIVVLHVGTNDIGFKAEWCIFQRFRQGLLNRGEYEHAVSVYPCYADPGQLGTFRKDVGDILNLIHMVNPNCSILISAILPRVWDHFKRHHVRVEFNRVLQSFNCKRDRLFYIPSDKPFFYKDGGLKTQYFRPDGLHLSASGVSIFKSFIFEKVDKAIKGFLC